VPKNSTNMSKLKRIKNETAWNLSGFLHPRRVKGSDAPSTRLNI